jgi:hypothetical protein
MNEDDTDLAACCCLAVMHSLPLPCWHALPAAACCSHKYLLETTAKMLNKPAQQVNAITCHLGQRQP